MECNKNVIWKVHTLDVTENQINLVYLFLQFQSGYLLDNQETSGTLIKSSRIGASERQIIELIPTTEVYLTCLLIYSQIVKITVLDDSLF